MKVIKQAVLFLGCASLALLFWGCLTRAYTLEKPRVDLEISGNRGYLQGTPRADDRSPASRLSSTRKITVVEIELGKHPKEEEAESKAHLKEASAIDQDTSFLDEVIFQEPDTSFDDDVQEEEFPEEKEEYKLYKAQKGDTLQKVSYKFYKTTRRWNKIYKANKDILKSPDKLYPGQVIKIPL